jgi:hypothetical protein
MKGQHWIRSYLISDTELTLIKYELANIERNMIHTHDTTGSYDKIMDTLNHLRSA